MTIVRSWSLSNRGKECDQIGGDHNKERCVNPEGVESSPFGVAPMTTTLMRSFDWSHEKTLTSTMNITVRAAVYACL
jgi:hypothetical protein